jgi:hypothetical protein
MLTLTYAIVAVCLGLIYHGGLAVVIACESGKTLKNNPDFLIHLGFAILFFFALISLLTLIDKC